jgi:SAM-dependent methyltransferase
MIYDNTFFEDISQSSLSSAEIIVPIINKFISPTCVVDVGCGLGAWLAIFQINGVNKNLGIDGDYVDREKLLISKDKFLPINLNYPFEINEHFDLAICLEVAEHLHSKNSKSFVNSLTRLAPIILFSAAVPGQGGINHVNEQWPDYWAKLFKEEGYTILDPIRPIIWKDHRVAWYYRQNCFMYINNRMIENNEQYQEWATLEAQNDMLLIRNHVLNANLSLTYFVKRFPKLVISVLSRYLNREV